MSNDLLKATLFVDHIIDNFHFENIDFRPASKGKINIDITRTGNFKKDSLTEDNFAIMADEVELLLVGFNLDAESGETVSEAFRLSAMFKVIYLVPEEVSDKFDTDFFEDNGWFFKNYAHHCGHEVFSSVLKNTDFDVATRSIPAFRVDVEPSL